MAEDLKFEVTKWQPGIIETNLDEVEAAVKESLKKYKGILVQESDIPDAKKTKTAMNALAKQINDWRIQKEREFMAPFQEKKDQCNRIVKMIKDTSGEIDSQLKAFDQREKETKTAEIQQYWNEIKPKELEIDLQQVWDDRYLNKTGLGQKWKEDLKTKSEAISKDLNVITNMIMSDKEQGSFIAEEYRKTLNLGSAITKWNDHVAEQQRIAQMQAEAEAKRAQQETSRKAAEEAQKVTLQQHEESSIPAENVSQQPHDEAQNGPVMMYWAEFRVQDATLEQMKALTAAFKQIGLTFHLLRNPDGTPRKGNSAK